MKDRINTLLLITTIVALLIAFDSFGLLKRYAEPYVKDVYFVGVAIAWQTISLLVWLIVKQSGSRILKVSSLILVMFALNNLTDEIFFDPYVTGWNEYVFGIAVVLWAQYFIQE